MDITIDEVSLGGSEIYRDMVSSKIAWQGNDDDEIETSEIHEKDLNLKMLALGPQRIRMLRVKIKPSQSSK